MYNIVLIGCGHMGMVHLDDIYTMENINIHAVIDVNIERAEFFARKYNAKITAPITSLLLKIKKPLLLYVQHTPIRI